MQLIPDSLVVNEKHITFWPEESQSTILVESSNDFEVEIHDSWCQVEYDRISGELKIFVEENDKIGIERSTTIVLQLGNLYQNIDVRQLAYHPYIVVDKEEVYLNDRQSSEFFIKVESNVEYQLELPDWIRCYSKNILDSNAHVFTFEVIPLDGSLDLREGIIRIAPVDKKFNETEIKVEQRNSNSQVKIGTYNIYVGNWTNSRKELVYEVIRKNNFDIFGLQEGTIVHLKDIENRFDEYYRIGVGRDGGEKGEFSAIFYKKDLYELLSQGSFWFSKTPNEPSYGWDASDYRRICTWGEFRDKFTNARFYVFNSHYDHLGEIARKESSKLLLKKMKKIREDIAYPIFSIGDFNANAETEPIQVLLKDGFLFDSRELSIDMPYGPYGTFQGFDINLESENRIDYIFVTDNVIVKNYGVINDRIDGQCPSDHDPVVVEAEF